MSCARVGVVGCGHLGKIHARLLAGRDDCKLVGVVDPVSDVASAVAETHDCESYSDPEDLVGRVDAAIVAAPTGLHAKVAIPLLEAGIDLLIEKPIAASVEDARAIVVTARRYGRVVAVGHVERFNPAWALACQQPGKPLFIESARLAPFTYRSLDVGVVFDLMIHDIDAILSVVPSKVASISASGVSVISETPDIANARLVFEIGFSMKRCLPDSIVCFAQSKCESVGVTISTTSTASINS
jgi:predicted dehydrogenase